MAASEKSKVNFEDEVLDILKKGGMKRENLNELVKAVSGLRRDKLKAVKVFTKGTINPDAIEVRGIVETAAFSAFFQDLLTIPQLGEIRVFPLGIPYPDWLELNFEIR